MQAAESGNEQATRRVYGVLATGLAEALDEARAALEPHAKLLPERRIAEFDALLEEFRHRRVRLAIYGEVKAGKSTLINAIAGQELSPSAFDPLTSVPVRLTYGAQTTWRIGDLSFDSVDHLARAMRKGVGATHVDVETNLDLLQLGGQVDLLDTPGVGSEERFDEISADALRSLDAVVLVVRYPALFTQYTRRLMDGLEADIGKLFVVWNLDGDCADLSPEERATHGETLRRNVAGAHELYLVDARAALRARQAGDAAATQASGLDSFIEALARFASSEKRELAALREAAKRSHEWLDDAKVKLAGRQDKLRSTLAAARGRLEAVQRKADERTSAAQADFEAFRRDAGQIGGERAAAAAKGSERLLKDLRAARRRWIRSGDGSALDASVTRATGNYADAAEVANRVGAETLNKRAAKLGATVSILPRARKQPGAAPFAPDDRRQRAATGSLRMLRRALWRRWYLPGVASLEQKEVAADLSDQESWYEQAARQAEEAVRAVLDVRLEEIRDGAVAEAGKIKKETRFDPNQSEFDALSEHLPVIESSRDNVTEISREARALID